MGDDPELEDVRSWYIEGRRVHNPFASDATLVQPFDRWYAAELAAAERRGAEKALREAADDLANRDFLLPPDHASMATLVDWLRVRAAEKRGETNE